MNIPKTVRTMIENCADCSNHLNPLGIERMLDEMSEMYKEIKFDMDGLSKEERLIVSLVFMHHVWITDPS